MRYFIRFSYNGSKYSGYQIQPDKITVQSDLENVLSKIFDEKIKICASGRTDALVHAYAQCAHFDSDKVFDFDKLRHSLNSLLQNIYIKELCSVSSDFHARYSVVSKEYIYKINVGEYNPIEREYVYQYNKSLDVDLMRNAIKYFVGVHDFKSFCSLDYDKDCCREIFDAYILVDDDILTIGFVGNGFLRYMVRNMVGVLIEIGSHKRDISSINDIFTALDRRKCGICANPEGLYLKNVNY